MLARLPELAKLGFPIMVGTSRKGFIGRALGGASASERIWGTAATVAQSILGGAHIVRVHDVAEMAQVARVTDLILRPAAAASTKSRGALDECHDAIEYAQRFPRRFFRLDVRRIRFLHPHLRRLAGCAGFSASRFNSIAFTLTASLLMRPVGALLFGLMADRWGRRIPLMLDIVFYSIMEVLSGLAPSYKIFLILRLLYGVGMGGAWGVGASLAMESAPAKSRGILSGILQEGYALGNLLAAIAFWTVFPRWGWRPMFFIGVVPALLTLLILSRVEESEAWKASAAQRKSWKEYFALVGANWKRFLYLVAPDGDHELQLARHAGPVSHIPAAPAPFQHAHHGNHQRDLHDRRHHWRNCRRRVIGPFRQAPRDGHVHCCWRCC